MEQRSIAVPTAANETTTLRAQFSGSDGLPEVSRIDLHFELRALNAPDPLYRRRALQVRQVRMYLLLLGADSSACCFPL
jgi:hypothetical protein